jgi:hypothetical protein
VTETPEPRSSWLIAWAKEWRKALDAAYVAWHGPGADAAIEDVISSLPLRRGPCPATTLGQVQTRTDVEIDEGQVPIEASLVEPAMNTYAGIESGRCHRTVRFLGAGIQGIDGRGLRQVSLRGRDTCRIVRARRRSRGWRALRRR